MQEFAILLSSLAGVATAAAVRKMPRNKTKLLSLGASSHIKSQINQLKIEKDILTKTISRLYQADSEYSKIQRDKLLLKYQHQLGIVLAKLEKLEQASHHPDLGPVGDGLITLMDQKLSKLDDRLYELSSKIQTSEIKPKSQQTTETVKEDGEKKQKSKQESFKFDSKQSSFSFPPNTKRTPFELATLTRFSKKEPKFFAQQKEIVKPKQDIIDEVITNPKVDDKVEIIQSSTQTTQPKIETPKVEIPEQKPKPKPEIPLGPKPDLVSEVSKINQHKALPSPQEKPKTEAYDEIEEDDGDDDIDKIKGDIMRVLAKLDQAEVE